VQHCIKVQSLQLSCAFPDVLWWHKWPLETPATHTVAVPVKPPAHKSSSSSSSDSIVAMLASCYDRACRNTGRSHGTFDGQKPFAYMHCMAAAEAAAAAAVSSAKQQYNSARDMQTKQPCCKAVCISRISSHHDAGFWSWYDYCYDINWTYTCCCRGSESRV
jgi:hypothetical protein